MGFDLLETVELASAGQVVFENIPQDGQTLVIYMHQRRSIANNSNITTVNNAASGGTNNRIVNINGSISSTGFSTSSPMQARMVDSDTTSTLYSTTVIYITNYTSSTDKGYIINNGAVNTTVTTDSNLYLVAGNQKVSAPTTTITTQSSQEAGTVISLYRISNS